MQVLVTGGAGFIGSHIADAYLAQGAEVTVLDNLSSGRRENVPAGARLVEEDVRAPAARRLLAEGGFAVLNHHAAQMDVRVSVRDPGFDAQVNLLGLLNLLEGAREGGVERVVFASSGGVVYGESEHLPHPEPDPKLPVSPYGVSKLASEYYLAQYAILYGLGVRSLRYANVYGPRQSPHGEAGVVAIFGSRLRDRRPITIFGDGEQTRDYVFVGDVARANMLATSQATPTTPSVLDDLAMNVGTAHETSVNDLARTLMRSAGITVPIEHAPARPGELQRSSVAIDRATSLGWRPEVSLEDGLRRTFEWLCDSAEAA